jgi:hypothetical protein
MNFSQKKREYRKWLRDCVWGGFQTLLLIRKKKKGLREKRGGYFAGVNDCLY